MQKVQNSKLLVSQQLVSFLFRLKHLTTHQVAPSD